MTDEIVLDVVKSGRADWLIQDAIIGGELERTIDGASTLTIELHDPYKRIVKAITTAVDLQYDGTWFRLVKLAKSGVSVTLTFEDRDVAYLRRHDKPRKVSRGTMTRAQFVRSLVREVHENHIRFFCPEINEQQPIAKTTEKTGTTVKRTTEKRTKEKREDDKQKGIPDDAQVAVRGVGASKEQRRNAERVLDVADQLGAGPKATKALIEACIVESAIKNLNYGDRDSLGILQVRVSTSGSAARSKDIEWCVRQFLTKGFYTDPQLGGGGAMAIARRHPEVRAGRVAQATQGSGFPERYDIFSEEADGWIDAYGGVSGTDTGGTTTTTTTVRRKRYEFSRGEPGKREDSWTAIQRLADEVNWRAFVDRGRLYFITEERLISAKASYIVSEDTDGVSWIDFDIDQGKKLSEATVTARTDLFDVRIGSVIAIRDMGQANGRYLVSGVRQNLFSADTEISLKRATPKLPEPAPETTSKTTTKTSGDGSAVAGKGKPQKAPSDPTVENCWRKVNAIDKKNYTYAWGGGHASFKGPYDCSGFVSAVLNAAGMLAAPMGTGGLINWGDAGQGRYMTVWVKETGDPHQSHTFMTFKIDGKEYFAEAGGAQSDHTGWHKPRDKTGFKPRNWPGT
jgi:hypothetical protein